MRAFSLPLGTFDWSVMSGRFAVVDGAKGRRHRHPRDTGPRRLPSGEDVGDSDRAERLPADRDRDLLPRLEVSARLVTVLTRIIIDLDPPLGTVVDPADRDAAFGVGNPFLAAVAIVGALRRPQRPSRLTSAGSGVRCL